jgi:probable HAF family extracellular repeat protein
VNTPRAHPGKAICNLEEDQKRTMKRTIHFHTAVAITLAWNLLAAQQTYSVLRIPDLGGQDTRARAINDQGEVVGTATLEGDTETRGFYFDGSSTVLLEGLTPDAATAANGLNDNGDIAGQSIDLESLTTSPVLWRGGELVDLSRALGCTGGTALAVNDSGVVVGMAAVDSPFSKGFIWNEETGGQIVGTLEGRNGGANRAINNAGVVVGDSFFFGDAGQAHLVSPGEHAYETQPIGAPPPYSGVAWSVNNTGLIVGMSAPSFSPHTAAIFTPGAQEPLIDLGTLPGAMSSVAFDVNDSGVIVGSSGDHPEWASGHAFVVLDGILYDLHDLIDDGLDQWQVLVEATAINNHGEIVGWGETQDGQISAFLLLPSGLPSVFRRGDSNADGNPDLSDAVFTLSHLFSGGSMPSCGDAADADDNGVLEITDAIYFLNFLFLGGPSPDQPFPSCGPDPTMDGLTCESFEGCLPGV